MNFLDGARQKPLSERKRLVWILSISSLVIVIAAWLAFFNEWKLPSMDISQSTDLKEIVNEAKDSTSLLQEQITSLQETTDEIKQASTIQANTENQSTSFTKKNVQVSLVDWQQNGNHGLVTVGLHNLADQAVSFESFTLRQGYEEVTAPLTEKLESQQKKELVIDFLLLDDRPVTAFEIKKVFFSEEDSWNYLFAIKDAVPETPATPEATEPSPPEPTPLPPSTEEPTAETETPPEEIVE